MITLHGFASSNYYNVVKYALLYKALPFEEHLIYSGGDEWLAISPAGKVPAITTEDGEHLCETTVICDYLEAAYPDRPLYPADPLGRAKVQEIMKVAELYLELPSRRLIRYAFAGKTAPDPVKADAREVTERGIGALRRLCRFSPHIAGSDFTLADIYVHYVNAVVDSIGSKQLEWDILAEIPGMKDWHAHMRESEIARQVEADRQVNAPDFQAYLQQYMARNARPDK